MTHEQRRETEGQVTIACCSSLFCLAGILLILCVGLLGGIDLGGGFE